MDAPERIWAFNAKQTGYRFYAAGPQPEFDNVEFRRADLCADPARLAEAVEVLRFYADPTFNGYDVTIRDYGLSVDTGEIIKDNGDRARAFLSKLENRQ